VNYYWWRSNGESGASGFIYGKHKADVLNSVKRDFKETDIFVKLVRENVRQKKDK
jgi:hypothetical protein